MLSVTSRRIEPMTSAMKHPVFPVLKLYRCMDVILRADKVFCCMFIFLEVNFNFVDDIIIPPSFNYKD